LDAELNQLRRFELYWRRKMSLKMREPSSDTSELGSAKTKRLSLKLT
jgi:hypothetical protein